MNSGPWPICGLQIALIPGGILALTAATRQAWAGGNAVFGWHGYHDYEDGSTINALDAKLAAAYPTIMTETNGSIGYGESQLNLPWIQGLYNCGEATWF